MSLEKSQKILKAMWEKVAKPGADGKKYIIIKNRTDLEYHYWSGFVDDEKYTPAASGGPAVAGSGFAQGPGPSQQVADKLSQLIAKRER